MKKVTLYMMALVGRTLKIVQMVMAFSCCTFINYGPLYGSVFLFSKRLTLEDPSLPCFGGSSTAPIQLPPSHSTFAAGSSCVCTRLPIEVRVSLSALARHHGIAQSLHAIFFVAWQEYSTWALSPSHAFHREIKACRKPLPSLVAVQLDHLCWR